MLNYQKILIVKLDHIGDLLLATPVFQAIKNKYPNAYLTVVVNPSSAVVLKNNPYIDKVYTYSSKTFMRDGMMDTNKLISNLDTILKIRSEHYSLAVGLREDYNSVPFLNLLNARETISFKTNTIYSEFLTYSIENDNNKHMSEVFFDLLHVMKIDKPKKILPQIYIEKSDTDWVHEFLYDKKISTEEHKVLIISPGGGWKLNWWPWENYANLCNKIIQYDDHIRILIVGGEAERAVADNILSCVHTNIFSIAGETTLHQLAALYKIASLVVTNDGGMMHLATTAAIPIIALFGPSPDQRFGPLGKESLVINKKIHCAPCPQFVYNEEPHCTDNKCMQLIDVDEVYQLDIKKIS